MLTRCLLVLPIVWLATLAGVPHTPVGAEDKPKGDPPARAKDDKDRELHAVGIYEGYTKSEGKIHGGKAQVLVQRPGKKVTLVLTSYAPVTWEVAIDKDTIVEKVILGGYKRSAVKGLPEKVEVIEAFNGVKNAALPFYAYKFDTPNFRALVEALDGMTGRKLTSFTGVYGAKADDYIEVNQTQTDARLSIDYPVPVAAEKLPKLTFQAHHSAPGAMPHEVTRSFGEFTLTGPKTDTLLALPKDVSRITYDPVGKKYYGIHRHALGAIDMEKKKAVVIDTGLQVPEISWPADVTFDTKRERVLLATSGGGGYLYAYTPKTGKWEALAEKPAQVLAYHAKDDVIYGLKSDLGREGVAELQAINAQGAVVTAAKISGEFLPGVLNAGPGVSGLQLIPAGDKLVLLISPTERLGGSEVPLQKMAYTYLIDPKTGKAELAWKGKVGGK